MQCSALAIPALQVTIQFGRNFRQCARSSNVWALRGGGARSFVCASGDSYTYPGPLLQHVVGDNVQPSVLLFPSKTKIKFRRDLRCSTLACWLARSTTLCRECHVFGHIVRSTGRYQGRDEPTDFQLSSTSLMIVVLARRRSSGLAPAPVHQDPVQCRR